MNTDAQGNEIGKLFVGGLHQNTTNDALKKYFSTFGQVEQAIVMIDNNTQRSRGFGYVKFAEDESVTSVITAAPHTIDEKEVDAKRCNVNMKGKNRRSLKIFVGGVAPEVTEGTIKEYFQQYGNVVDVNLMIDPVKQRHRGFAFVGFDDENVVKELIHMHHAVIGNKTVEIKPMEPPNMRRQNNPAGGMLNTAAAGLPPSFNQMFQAAAYHPNAASLFGAAANGAAGNPFFNLGRAVTATHATNHNNRGAAGGHHHMTNGYAGNPGGPHHHTHGHPHHSHHPNAAVNMLQAAAASAPRYGAQHSHPHHPGGPPGTGNDGLLGLQQQFGHPLGPSQGLWQGGHNNGAHNNPNSWQHSSIDQWANQFLINELNDLELNSAASTHPHLWSESIGSAGSDWQQAAAAHHSANHQQHTWNGLTHWQQAAASQAAAGHHSSLMPPNGGVTANQMMASMSTTNQQQQQQHNNGNPQQAAVAVAAGNPQQAPGQVVPQHSPNNTNCNVVVNNNGCNNVAAAAAAANLGGMQPPPSLTNAAIAANNLSAQGYNFNSNNSAVAAANMMQMAAAASTNGIQDWRAQPTNQQAATPQQTAANFQAANFSR